MRTALIAGATGLVGAALLSQLLEGAEYDRVIAVGRRAPERTHPKLVPVVADFAALQEVSASLACDDVFCCLGTTIKVAGSREAFRAVDHVAVLALAVAAQRQSAQRFFLVSSAGADARSLIFYSRIKGETEEALRVLRFSTLAIFRPSLLLGSRAQPRRGEGVSAVVLALVKPLLIGSLRKFRAIRGDVVARAMVRCALGHARGVVVFASDEIEAMGGAGA